jgi:hypothetical protein
MLAFIPLLLLFSAVIFVPLLIIAIVKFKSVAVAFAVSATFTLGAALGLFVSLALAQALIPRSIDGDLSLYSILFAAAGSIGGAALSLKMLRKLAGDQKWEKR